MSEATLKKIDVYRQLDEVNKDIAEAENKLERIIKVLNEKKEGLRNLVKEKADELKWSRFRPEYLQNFVEEPYIIEPSKIGKRRQRD